MKTNKLLPVGLMAVLLTASAFSQAKTIRFSGYDWIVRHSGTGGPGPNYWDENNVWVDGSGFLHLKLSRRAGRWWCSEVYSRDRFGFGRYQFWVIGRVDTLDPNVVFGLFSYPTPDVGPDGTNELDIEFAQWGRKGAPIGNYTVWPAGSGLQRSANRFLASLNGNYTTHRFTWSPISVYFQSLNGHRDDSNNQFANWLFQPSDPRSYLSQKPMPVRINLWCFKGQPPANAQQVELVVHSFQFTPR